MVGRGREEHESSLRVFYLLLAAMSSTRAQGVKPAITNKTTNLKLIFPRKTSPRGGEVFFFSVKVSFQLRRAGKNTALPAGIASTLMDHLTEGAVDRARCPQSQFGEA